MLFQILAHDLHGAVIAAHGASLIVGFVLALAVLLRLHGVDSQVQLRRPVELLARLRHLQIPLPGSLIAVGKVCSMSSDTRSNNALAHIVDVRQAQMLCRRYVAEEVCAAYCSQRTAET